jgi:AhpC/TSA family
MRGVDGAMHSIASSAGVKGTLIVFICNHCPWVKAWQGRLVEIGNSALTRGIGVIMINPNDPGVYPEDDFAHMKDRARALGFEFPYVVDATSSVARAFGATHTPEAFLFDARGALVYHGAVDDDARRPEAVAHRYLHDAVEALLAGRPIEPQETKALGCSLALRK